MTLRGVVAAGLLAGGTALGLHALTIPAKAALADVLLERAWHRARLGEERPRPWSWADTWPVARLSIPDLGWSTLVLDGASGRELAFAPGRLHGSAAPGSAGTLLIAGHRDTHFSVLRYLSEGQSVTLEDSLGTIHRYRIRESRVVDAVHHGIRRHPVESQLVLMTCWPFDALAAGGPDRLVVWADPEPPGHPQTL
jgi:sortase A